MGNILSLCGDSSMLFPESGPSLRFLFRNHAPLPVSRSFCLILRRTNKNFRKCVDSFSTLPIMRLHTAGVISSVGRASPLHGGGRRFEPVIAHHSHLIAAVPKWAISSVGRASPLHGGGRRFEPVIAHHFGSLAQLVEQLTFNQLVAGSNPARPTNVKKRPKGAFLLSAIWMIRTCSRFEPNAVRHRSRLRRRPEGRAKRVILHDPPM